MTTNFIRNEIFTILNPLINYDDNGDLLQGVGVALLTILIPLAIAVLTGYLDKKANKKESEVLNDLELGLIIEQIFNIKLLVFSSVLVFVPTLFWNKSIHSTRYIELTIWLIGILLIIWTIIKIYRWMKRPSTDYSYHLEYLRTRFDIQDNVRLWDGIWSQSNFTFYDESQFIKEYSDKIDWFIKNSISMGHIPALLQSITNTLDKRHVEALFYAGDFFPRLLSWHYTIYIQYEQKMGSEHGIDMWANYNFSLQSIDTLIKALLETTLIGNTISVYPFFNQLEKHYNSTKSNEKYWKYLVNKISKEYFNLINDSPASYDIWDSYFPSEWKVTINNLENRASSPSAWFWLLAYIDWAQPRINAEGNDFDPALENVTRELFPEIEPTTFSVFMIFIATSFGENRMKSLIEKDWNFGYTGRIYTSWNGNEQGDLKINMKEQEIATIKFIKYLHNFLPNLYPADEILDGYILDLKKLQASYEKGSKEYRHVTRLLNLITSLKN